MEDARRIVRDGAAMLRIVHHIPGRVRLKLLGGPALAGKLADAQRLLRAARAVPGIRAVDVNGPARSCVVEYDAKRIPPAAWQDLLSGAQSPDGEALLAAMLDAWMAPTIP